MFIEKLADLGLKRCFLCRFINILGHFKPSIKGAGTDFHHFT
jgi:hypothetical protein